MSTQIIEVSSLHKRYGSKVAVEDVSFSVDQGEIFGIVGPNADDDGRVHRRLAQAQWRLCEGPGPRPRARRSRAASAAGGAVAAKRAPREIEGLGGARPVRLLLSPPGGLWSFAGEPGAAALLVGAKSAGFDLINLRPFPNPIPIDSTVSLRRAKFSSTCREVGLNLRPIASGSTRPVETGQIRPISRRRSPISPAKVKPAATAEITTSGRRVRLAAGSWGTRSNGERF